MKRIVSLSLLAYFRWLAKLQLKKISPIIIGITGTAGKTSTLQACEAVLTDHFQLKVSHKANSESGIPLNILDLHLDGYSSLEWLKLAILAPLQVLFNWSSYDIYLVELGIDGPEEPKNMSYLLKIVQPEVGIFLNAAPNHTEPFDHLIHTTDKNERRQQLIELVAKEKGKLITSLPKSGTAILNSDDESVKQFEKKTRATVLTFGKNAPADIQIISMKPHSNGTECDLKYIDKSYKIFINEYILPNAFAQTLAAAIGCGLSQKISIEHTIVSLEKNFKLPPGRSSIIPAINEATILDSSYNASTAPMLDMLELLHNTPSKRKLALLGDMRELGEVAETEHEVVAEAAAKTCDAVFLIGPIMKKCALPLLEKTQTPVQWFSNAYKAADYLQTFLEKDDVLLVKASQNTLLLEIAIEKLMAHPEDANKLLCRRSSYWDRQREKLRS